MISKNPGYDPEIKDTSASVEKSRCLGPCGLTLNVFTSVSELVGYDCV